MAEQPPEPRGLVYQPDFITEAEERHALDVLCETLFGLSAADLAAQFGGPAETDWYGHGSWCRRRSPSGAATAT